MAKRLLPAQFEKMFAEARQAVVSGDFAKATKLFAKLIKVQPENCDVLFACATCHLSLNDDRNAALFLKQIIKLKPDHVGAHHDLAMIHLRASKHEDALQEIEKAYEIDPNEPHVIALKANLLFMAGRYDEAYTLIKPAIDNKVSSLKLAIVFASISKKVGKEIEAITYLENQLKGAPIPPEQRVGVFFTLGELYDKAEEYDKAFNVYERANSLKPDLYNPEKYSSAVDQVIANWTPEAIAEISSPNAKSDNLVFIVGMPRSGTSLVEQILACRDDVFGGGEVANMGRYVLNWTTDEICGGMAILSSPSEIFSSKNSASLARCAQSYLREVSKHVKGDDRFTDKQTINFQHLGLIQLLFPDAKIIHCVRNPLDTCLSCYFHDFLGRHPYTYNLEHLGQFYTQYQRLMSHWTNVLNLKIHDVVYEELIQEQVKETRRLIDFLNLPWDDVSLRYYESKRITMTSSNEQVRQPVYTKAIGRHKHYEKHLDKLKTALTGT